MHSLCILFQPSHQPLCIPPMTNPCHDYDNLHFSLFFYFTSVACYYLLQSKYNRSLHLLLYSSWPVAKMWSLSASAFYTRAEVTDLSV